MNRYATQCPRCRQDYTTRVPVEGAVERTVSAFYLYPFHCKLCNERFSAFKFGVKYRKRHADRRQYQRIANAIPIEVQIGEVSHLARSVDISMGGCRLRSTSSLKEGDIVTLGLQILHDESPLKIEAAVVRYADEEQAGLEFLHMGDMESRILRQYISSLMDCFAPESEQRLAG